MNDLAGAARGGYQLGFLLPLTLCPTVGGKCRLGTGTGLTGSCRGEEWPGCWLTPGPCGLTRVLDRGGRLTGSSDHAIGEPAMMETMRTGVETGGQRGWAQMLCESKAKL